MAFHKIKSEDSTDHKDKHAGNHKDGLVRGMERPGYILIPNDMPRNAPDVKFSVDKMGKMLQESNYREIFPDAMKEMGEGDPETP